MTKSQKNHKIVPQSQNHKSFVFEDRNVLGYNLDSDLLVHYDFLEYIYLLSTGNFPNENQKKGLDLLLRNLTLSKGNATSLHAARASRCSGGKTQATIFAAVLTAEREYDFDTALDRELKTLGFESTSVSDAFAKIGISPDFAKTLGVFLSSFGTLSEAFRGEAKITEFPTSLPQFEYDCD